MEQAAYATVRQQEPDETVLQEIYDQDPSAYMRPAMIEFDHVYISSDLHPDATGSARVLASEMQGRPFSGPSRHLIPSVKLGGLPFE